MWKEYWRSLWHSLIQIGKEGMETIEQAWQVFLATLRTVLVEVYREVAIFGNGCMAHLRQFAEWVRQCMEKWIG